MRKQKTKRWIVSYLTGVNILFVLTTTMLHAKNCGRTMKYTSYSTTGNTKLLTAGIVGSTLDNSVLMHLKREEDVFYPSSDLYEGSWNPDFLKAYVGIEGPDSFVVDVSDLVLPVIGKVTSCFGPRGSGEQFHYGTDIRLRVGDTVRAVFDGKVRLMKYEQKGYGYYLVLRHFNGLETVYGHLSEFIVIQGENVKAGQPIALGGSTGQSTGPHLHFEFRLLGVAINAEEIIDFDELAIKSNIYVYRKGKQNYIDANHSINQHGFFADQWNGYHQIVKGETLYSISKKYGTTVDKLCKINQLNSDFKLRIGSSIRIS